MNRPVIIVDCETTSLVPNYASRTGEIWELAMIERDCGAMRLYRMEPDISRANGKALSVGRFHERTAEMRQPWLAEVQPGHGAIWDLTEPGDAFWSSPADLAPHVAGLLDGATLVAANPAFDAGFLSAFLSHYGCKTAPWHYRLRDIGSMAWGWLNGYEAAMQIAAAEVPVARELLATLAGTMPVPGADAGTEDFARALGIDPGQFDRHTALGDCRLVAAMLDVIEGGAS